MSEAAELSAIHGVLDDPSLIYGSSLTPEMFTTPARRETWRLMQELANANLRIDEITVRDRAAGSIREEVKFVLVDAVMGPGAPSNFEAYQAIIQRDHSHEEVRKLGERLAEAPEQVDDILRKLSSSGTKSRWEHDQLQSLDAATRLIERMQAGIAGCTTGFKSLDRSIQKLVPGRCTMIGGRPSMGKTALASSIGIHAGVPVGFISSEMPVDQIVVRWLSQMSGVPIHAAQGGMSPQDWDRWNEASAAFRETPAYFNDKPGITPADIWQQARKWKYNNGIELLIVDYIQNLNSPGEDRVAQIRASANMMPNIAKQLDIHVIALSQVNRDVERRDNKRPMMSDFDGASTIEAAADHMVAMYRPWVYDKSQDPRIAELILVKNRHGPVGGTTFARFEPSTTLFTESQERTATPF
jgi:replicative DNA helicase